MPGSDMMADSTLTVDKIQASRETRLSVCARGGELEARHAR